MELNRKTPSICNVWDPMDSFDGIFLEENANQSDSSLPPSELKLELDLLVENVSSTRPSPTKSIKCQK